MSEPVVTSRSETILRRIGSLWCGLTGHVLIKGYDDGRLYMKCVCCPYESLGVVIGGKT